ncbi:hypothetical protein [Breznakibacter xylanolyticus]|uniref:hypothetical protein n=1 Tax=Breznakibacter xylanolyticus TaxID=990 RepID=UPI0011B5854E|nr:hypothetical protein [Breznakibacter xylanolyticus]
MTDTQPLPSTIPIHYDQPYPLITINDTHSLPSMTPATLLKTIPKQHYNRHPSITTNETPCTTME